MFDAKKVLDALTAASQAPGASPGSLGDVLGAVIGQLQSGQTAAGGAPAGSAGTSPAATGGGLADVIGGVLSQLQGQAGQGGAAGGLGGLLGSLFGQATQGLQGAARQTGAGPAIDDVLRNLTGGKGAGDLLAQAQEAIRQTPQASAAVAGTLGTLFLGTKAGRGLAVDAAKLGGLALIGGLAYQAWQNYQQGKPPISLGAPQEVAAPPASSSFGASGDAARDNARAQALLQAMIAAACADGAVDAQERAMIVGNLQAIGMDPEAARFLDAQFAHPATPAQLAEAADGPEAAIQIYTAARLTIDPDRPSEQLFLSKLSQELGLDAPLVAQIDAAAENAKTARA